MIVLKNLRAYSLKKLSHSHIIMVLLKEKGLVDFNF